MLEKQQGSSLLELMLVVSLVLVLLGGILTGVVSHQRQRQSTIERQLALAACRNTLEQLRSVDIADLPALDGSGFDVPGPDGRPGGLQPRAGDPDGLVGEIRVVLDTTAGTESIYIVSVGAQWRGSGPNGDLRLHCLLGRRR